MPAQGPSTNIAQNIDMGNAIVYIGPKQASFSACQSSTAWRRLGMLKGGAQIQISKGKTDFFSGVPTKKQASIYTSESVSISGEFNEFSAVNLARALGGPPTTIAAKVSPSTTVKTGSTPTVSAINLTSITGFSVGQEVEVTSGSIKQYGVIKSISGDLVTFFEGLDQNVVPSVGDAVKLVDTKSMVIGSVAVAQVVAIKLEKVQIGTNMTWAYYIPNAQADGNITLGFGDNTNSPDSVSIPFLFEALSDPLVENGNLMNAIVTQN